MSYQKKTLPLRAVLVILLSGIFISPTFSSDNIPTPVTDELLQKLGLDRQYHKCISVADGDTITLEDIGTVRFVGVDTPEKNHPKLPVQFMSQEASKFTRQLCLGKKVRLEYDPYDEDKKGNYGRVLGYLYLEDGTFVQEELLKKGYAIAYTKYPLDENRKQKFLKIEQEAKDKGVGIWNDSGLTEVKWILKRNYPMFQITYLGNKHWSLRYWKYILEPVPFKKLEANVKQLYSWIYELSSKDLNLQLIKSGYKQNSDAISAQSSFFLFGMAHKKWGILYENYVYPRVLLGELDDKCEQIIKIITEGKNGDHLQGLVKKGYRLISTNYTHSPTPIHSGSDCPKTENSGSYSSLVCWDEAGQFIGKTVTITGKVNHTFKNDKVCFLNFHNNFTRYMSVVIFASKFRHFSANLDKYFLNKTIHVTGKIKDYKGKPEIIVNKPAQIKVVD